MEAEVATPSAREALNARVREMIDRRLGGCVTPCEEAAEYVRALRLRGFSCRQIGERLGGVPKSTVNGWGQGRSAPSDPVQFERLAMMARNALQLPVTPKRHLTGMPLVLDTLRRARRCSMRELTRQLGLRSAAVGSSWMNGVQQPGRMATRRILRLAKACALPAELIAICDARLAEIAKFERVRAQASVAARAGG